MLKPFFSVIIPTYNRAALLTKAVESVINQSFKDWELIIVDDGSTDNTQKVVESYNDSSIFYIYKENKERSAARNKGIELSRGEYICFLDSDDYFLNNRLELLNNEILKRGEPVCFFYTSLKFTNGIELTYNNIDSNVYDYLINNIIGVPQVCVNSAILNEFCFNEDFYIAEDLELWLRIAKKYPLIYLENQTTVIATQHEDRTVNERKFNPGFEQLKVLRYIFKKSHTGKLISGKVKNTRISNTYLSIARHFMYNNKKIAAIKNIILSIISSPIHKQTKHKFYIFIKLALGSIPSEYN